MFCQTLVGRIFAAGSLTEAVGEYTRFSGRMAPLPAWIMKGTLPQFIFIWVSQHHQLTVIYVHSNSHLHRANSHLHRANSHLHTNMHFPCILTSGAVIGYQGGTAAVRAMFATLRAAKIEMSAMWLQDWTGPRVNGSVSVNLTVTD